MGRRVQERTKTRTVYFDQNVFDHLLDAGIPGSDVAEAMRRQRFDLVLSEHNFQEWAVCWKSGAPEKEQRGRTLIGYALAVGPSRFLLPPPNLIRYEVGRIIGNEPTGPWLSRPAAESVRAFMSRFVEGSPTAADRENMLVHLKRKETTAAQANALVEAVKARGVHAAGNTLDEFIAANPDAVKVVGRNLILYRLQCTGLTIANRDKAAKMVLRRLDKCPAVRTAVRANCYINYRIATGTRTAHDVWDDLRHCVSAAYADVFVTGDSKLIRAFAAIRPGPVLTTTLAYAEQLGLPTSGLPGV